MGTAATRELGAGGGGRWSWGWPLWTSWTTSSSRCSNTTAASRRRTKHPRASRSLPATALTCGSSVTATSGTRTTSSTRISWSGWAPPRRGQQATFTYTAYNESGAKIDSSFKEGKPAVTQLGTRGMIPGFELALKGMRPGGRRRVIVVPALGPPVGPQTFFSAKQHEVFDIELLEVKDCRRVGFGFGFGSNLLCE